MIRFTLSLTRDMQINDLRIAIFSYITAKQKGEKFHIHIDDTDLQQTKTDKDQEILEILQLFGIGYESVGYQSQNIRFYQQFATKLLMDKKAFNCFCTKERLDSKKKEAKNSNTKYQYDDYCVNLLDSEVIDNENPFCIRLKRPNRDIDFFDHIDGKILFDKSTIDSFIVLRVDKSPTYNFAYAVDDMLNDISLVIKNQKHTSDTPKQIYIRESLGYEKKIEYAHMPAIIDGDSYSVSSLLKDGYLPSAIINYLITIDNKTPKEIFTLDEAIEWFSLKEISKTPNKFNINKLKEINMKHIEK